jgi:hypothetical protein
MSHAMTDCRISLAGHFSSNSGFRSTSTETITAELIETDRTPAVVIVRWPNKPSVLHPHRFPTAADIAARTFAAAEAGPAQAGSSVVITAVLLGEPQKCWRRCMRLLGEDEMVWAQGVSKIDYRLVVEWDSLDCQHEVEQIGEVIWWAAEIRIDPAV